MCGVFGFISKNGKGPDVPRLKRIARVTEIRGRHAFGLAWENDGQVETFKRPGAASSCLSDLGRVRGSQAVIGHCRWATNGVPEDNANNHPHHVGKGWLIHNGRVGNYLELVEQFDLDIQTECDSEVLGMLITRGGGSLLGRSRFMRSVAEGTMAVLGLWANPVRMLVMRSGRPLHFGEDNRGFYFASLASQLPGRVYALRDCRAYVLSQDDDGLWMESKQLN